MRTILTLVKWISWLAAVGLACLIILLTLVGSGPYWVDDWLFAILWCLVVAFPGILIHLTQKKLTQQD
jgi:hypothetical protein